MIIYILYFILLYIVYKYISNYFEENVECLSRDYNNLLFDSYGKTYNVIVKRDDAINKYFKENIKIVAYDIFGRNKELKLLSNMVYDFTLDDLNLNRAEMHFKGEKYDLIDPHQTFQEFIKIHTVNIDE